MAGPWEEFSTTSKMPWEEFTADEEPTAPRSRWDSTRSEIKKSLTEQDKKHSKYGEYKKYLETYAKEKKIYETPKPGDIPGGQLYKDPLSFQDWLADSEGELSAKIGRGAGAVLDTAAMFGGGVLDLASLPYGVGKGMLEGKSAQQAAEAHMGNPTYTPKTEGGQEAMKLMAQFPAFLPHVPVRATKGQILRNLQGEIRKAGIDVKPEEPITKPPIVRPDAEIDAQGARGYQIPEGQLRVDENGIPYHPQLSEGAVARPWDLFNQTPEPQIPEAPAKPAPSGPPMRVTPEGQAFVPSPDTAMWQDRAADMTREQQDQLAFFRQQALIREQEARAAEQAQGQIPLRGQTTDPFNPYPVVGDAASMEAMARAQGDVHYGQVPPDGVVPRDAPTRGMTMPRGNEWVVDENGIPVRQRMPETTIDPRTQTLTDARAIHDLGNAIQEANGPRLAPDNPQGAGRLAGPMGAPEHGIGPGKAGAGRGINRGAINLDGVKTAIEDFRKGFIKGPDLLRAFIGTFDSGMDHNDMSKTIGGGHIGWTPAIQDSRSPTSKGRLVWMSPEEFHAAALPRYMDSRSPNGIGERKRTSIRIGIHEDAGLSSIPVLRLNAEGKVAGHEGRHRMDVFKELGIKKAPVYLFTENHTNADGPIPRSHLLSEDGKKYIPTPKPVFPMGKEPVWAPPTPVGQAGLGRGVGLQRGGVDFGIGEQLKRGLQDVDDISRTLQTFKLKSPEEIISQALAAGRDGSGLDMLEAGATLTAMKRKSPFIEAVAHVIQWHKAAAERSIHAFVFPFETAVRKLGRGEVQDFATLLKQEMFSRTELSLTALADAGYSQKTLMAYQRAREMFNQAWAEQNKRLVDAGKKPLTKVEAYLNSQWQGNHRRAIFDAEGRLRWFLAADSLGRLERDTKALLKDFPELVPQAPFMATQVSDNPFISTRSKAGTDMAQIYRTMIEIMGDDPEFAKVKAWYEHRVGEEASHALGQDRVFKAKGNIRGFVGDRPLTGMRSSFTEALALLQGQANYAKSAFKWSALQDASEHLKPVFSNKELAEQQPRNMRYSKEYFMNQLGGNEYTWIKSMEDWVDKHLKFTSTNQVARGVNTTKALWTVQKLAFSLGYAVANVAQLPQALPYMAKIQMEHGGNPVFALGSGAAVGSMMVMQHQLNPGKVNLAKMFAAFPPDIRQFYAEAMKYAEDNGVVLSSAADEAPIAKSFGPLAKAKRIADWTISFPDSLRSIAFMTFASHLKSTGKFDHSTIFQKAHDMTVASMVDFREGEKAMVFNKFGVAGQAANTLQSYAINYFQQWNMWAREALNGNPIPGLVALGVQGAIGGAMGLPLFASIDKGIEWIKDWVKEFNPLLWNKVKDFSLKDSLLKAGGELGEHLVYGAASKNPTGVSIASRVQAPAPEEMLGVPFAPAIDFAKAAMNVGKAVVNPTAQNMSQAAYDLTPSGLQGMLETGPMRDQISVPRKNKDGEETSRVVARPHKMSDPTGIFERTPEEERLRTTGMRAQSEVFKRDQGYKASKSAQDAAEVVRELPKKIWNASRTGNQEELVNLIKLYGELSPGVKTKQDLSAAIEQLFHTQIQRTYTTSTERLVVPEKSIQSALAYKRYKDAMKAAGY